MITREQLQQCLPTNKEVDEWLPLVQKYLSDFDIASKENIAMFLAQCGHESQDFTRLSENLNYSQTGLLKTFGKYFNIPMSYEYARNPERIANKVYANRMGNGDEKSGDGWRYRGSGLIQTTGKDNHSAFAKFLERSVEDTSEYLRTKEGAIHGACYYWKTNNLNLYGGNVDSVSDVINRGRVTKVIGDAIGYKDRLEKYQKILNILS